MSSISRTDSREGVLNESWEEIQFQISRSASQSATPPDLPGSQLTPALSNSILHGQMEKLLLEAQRESSTRSSSCRGSTASSSRGSPKSPHSPNTEPSGFGLGLQGIAEITQEEELSGKQAPNTDWIWDWASRPEKVPPSDYNRYLKHPKRSPTSLRNTTVMRGGPFSLENLPLLLMTHACTFFLGAAAMFICLKKYCHFPVVTTPTID